MTPTHHAIAVPGPDDEDGDESEWHTDPVAIAKTRRTLMRGARADRAAVMRGIYGNGWLPYLDLAAEMLGDTGAQYLWNDLLSQLRGITPWRFAAAPALVERVVVHVERATTVPVQASALRLLEAVAPAVPDRTQARVAAVLHRILTTPEHWSDAEPRTQAAICWRDTARENLGPAVRCARVFPAHADALASALVERLPTAPPRLLSEGLLTLEELLPHASPATGVRCAPGILALTAGRTWADFGWALMASYGACYADPTYAAVMQEHALRTMEVAAQAIRWLPSVGAQTVATTWLKQDGLTERFVAQAVARADSPFTAAQLVALAMHADADIRATAMLFAARLDRSPPVTSSDRPPGTGRVTCMR